MSRISAKTQATLSQFVRDIKYLDGETPKTHRFTALLAELFPGSKIITDYVQGIEKVVRVDISGEERRRRMDAYYGNAIIEFEDSLKVTGKEAERQLREYTAGVWSKEGKNRRHLIPIASDGLAWRTYLPFLKKERNGKIQPEDIELDLVQEFTLGADKNLDFFWMWLSILLFRKERIEATSEHFRMDFGAESQAFRVCVQIMQNIWSGLKKASEPKLAFKTWQQYLAVTYGKLTQEENDLEGLFLKHTYLACVARLLIWASLSKGKANQDLGEVAEDVLSGKYFEARKLANLVEDDFFQWVRLPEANKELAPVWENIIAQLQTYDLSHLSEDVFKGVYQDLVDPKDRHDLGEYYTPDWLCDRMVYVLLPEKGYVSVLDPSCGSGSFLRATIDHFKKANAGDTPKKQLETILEHVAGIDIQPLAATISRATYVLALGDLIKEAKRPFTVPVYLADSLFLPTEVRQHVIGRKPSYEVTFGERKVEIPESLVTSSDLFDAAIAACTRVAADHAKEGNENKQRLARFLDQETNLLKDHPDREEVMSALWTFTDELSKLIRKRENSIWGFIVRNSYKPAMMKAQFDVIIGNPPWLSYRYISDPRYQTEVKKRAVDDYAIAPTHQKLFTQMELATIFLVHSIVWFGKPTALLGFVMPRSVLSADQHTKLRTRTYKADFRIERYWDLYEVRPLFNVPACVLFIKRSKDRGDVSDKVPAVEWEGKLPGRDVPWSEAQTVLKQTDKTARVIYLGNRDALSTARGKTVPGLPGPYNKHFGQGATIVPRNFYFVGFKDGKAGNDKEAVYWAKTDPVQAEDAKPPYNTVVMDGNVEGQFVYGTFLAKHLLPFIVLEPAPIVVPVLEREKGELSLLTGDGLREKGYREMGQWMSRAQDIWEEKREDKAENQTVYEWLDYQAKLTKQNLSDRHLVLYTTSGTNLSAACVDRKAYGLRIILDHKTYWASFASEDEGYYLSAILNSEAVNEAIKPFQSLGLMGERDIHKKVLDVPFPEFNKQTAKHMELASQAKLAEVIAKEAITSPAFPNHLPKRREFIRGQVADILRQIDEIVRALL